jgi:hypothetical protein
MSTKTGAAACERGTAPTGRSCHACRPSLGRFQCGPFPRPSPDHTPFGPAPIPTRRPGRAAYSKVPGQHF